MHFKVKTRCKLQTAVGWQLCLNIWYCWAAVQRNLTMGFIKIIIRAFRFSTAASQRKMGGERTPSGEVAEGSSAFSTLWSWLVPSWVQRSGWARCVSPCLPAGADGLLPACEAPGTGELWKCKVLFLFFLFLLFLPFLYFFPACVLNPIESHAPLGGVWCWRAGAADSAEAFGRCL